jgi:hypothetical protein
LLKLLLPLLKSKNLENIDDDIHNLFSVVQLGHHLLFLLCEFLLLYFQFLIDFVVFLEWDEPLRKFFGLPLGITLALGIVSGGAVCI